MTPYIYNKRSGEYIPYVEVEAGATSQNLRDETIDEFAERVGWADKEDEFLLDADTQVFDVPNGEVRWRVPAPLTPAYKCELDELEKRVAALEAAVAPREPQPQSVEKEAER